jgi:hypothetical protein
VRYRLLIRGLVLFAFILILSGPAESQAPVDSVELIPLSPDSLTVERRGKNIAVRWYPKEDSLVNTIGPANFSNWWYGHDETERVEVEFFGNYTGMIDRTVHFTLTNLGTFEVGASPSISVRIETRDKFWRYNQVTDEHEVEYETYSKRVNIGTSYNYGDTIPLELRGEDTAELLDLGVSAYFNDGLVDTTNLGNTASFRLDLQTYDGFRVWRSRVTDGNPGQFPSQDEMVSIAEISREDYHKYMRISTEDDVPLRRRTIWRYFTDFGLYPKYPRYDNDGRLYYEWMDDNVFPGFKYFYSVTVYDRHYNEEREPQDFTSESYFCGNDSIPCSERMKTIWMTVDAQENMELVYAVPNPLRTGTSAETAPYYHNYGDGNYIRFHNVPTQAQVWVFTVSGDLVWEGENDNVDGSDGVVTWDARNKEGVEVSSGIYLYRVKNVNGQDHYGKIIVIR